MSTTNLTPQAIPESSSSYSLPPQVTATIATPVKKSAGLKTCCSCHKTFPATAEFFYRNSKVTDGLSSACKSCHNQYIRNSRNSKGLTALQQYRLAIYLPPHALASLPADYLQCANPYCSRIHHKDEDLFAKNAVSSTGYNKHCKRCQAINKTLNTFTSDSDTKNEAQPAAEIAIPEETAEEKWQKAIQDLKIDMADPKSRHYTKLYDAEGLHNLFDLRKYRNYKPWWPEDDNLDTVIIDDAGVVTAFHLAPYYFRNYM